MDAVAGGAVATLSGVTCDNITGMKWFWWNASRADVMGVAIAVALIGLVAVVLMRGPDMQQGTNAGFGPDWECTAQAQGGPTCIKKPSK
jgi:hypothetical protein